MKKMINLLLFLLILTCTFVEGYSQVKVKGYYRKDGTYVQPHYRSNPDGNPYNNWSLPGNTNPYTERPAPGNEDTYLKNYYKNNSSNYNSYSNSNYSSSYYSFSGTGNKLVYTDVGNAGEICVFIDEEYIGILDKYFTYGQPSTYGW